MVLQVIMLKCLCNQGPSSLIFVYSKIGVYRVIHHLDCGYSLKSHHLDNSDEYTLSIF